MILDPDLDWPTQNRVLVSLVMRRILAGGLCLVLMSACYRESTPPIANARDPLVQRAAQTCSANDDLRHPPFEPTPEGRLRTHTSGSLSGTDQRTWAGPPIPSYVPQRLGTLELFILDPADRGHLAFYRDPYDVGSCNLRDNRDMNCAYEARHYTERGKLAWSLRLDEVMSRPDHLEIQDIRLADGVLYFNEACQSYAAESGNKCSSLVAVNPNTRQVLWRTDPLVSNGRFLVRSCYIVAGYGFTAEPDWVSLVDRGTGTVKQKLWVSSAPEQYSLVAGDQLHVTLYAGGTRRYALEGFDTDAGQLRDLDPAEYGGASYGGASYGGMGYGGMGYGGQTYGGRPLRLRK